MKQQTAAAGLKLAGQEKARQSDKLGNTAPEVCGGGIRGVLCLNSDRYNHVMFFSLMNRRISL